MEEILKQVKCTLHNFLGCPVCWPTDEAGWIIRTAERLVIEYANLSGRETANRAEFRKRATEIVEQAFKQQKADLIKEGATMKITREQAYPDMDRKVWAMLSRSDLQHFKNGYNQAIDDFLQLLSK